MDYRSAMLLIDRSRGMAGAILGPPCSVYRVGATASGNYLDVGQRVQTGLRVGRRQTGSKDLIEAPIMGGIFYTLLANAEGLEVGDVIVENDPYYGEGATEVDFATTQFEAYALAYHGPFKQTMAARVDRLCTIYRPTDAPVSGAWTPTNPNMAPVVLSAGAFSLGAVGATPTQIPLGLTSHVRTKHDLFKGLPGTTDALVYFGYVPALPGWLPREGDRLIDSSTGDRYSIQHPYTQQAGLGGSQMVLSRQIAGL